MKSTYYPLFMIIALIAISSFAGVESGYEWMLHFMAGFYLVFGAFKLIDLPGFANLYASYDLLAKRVKAYGYIYPFLEITLGFAFLFQVGIYQALWLSLILMGFGSLGVISALLEKRPIQCACLGSALKLPMSTITLIEDVGMGVMAVWMLYSPVSQ